MKCKEGEICTDGKCSVSCLDGQDLCGDLCVILNSDPQNCGKCGHQCPAGNACVDGECSASCLAGQELCGNACVTLESDSNNCGECGNKCPAGIDCIDGRCASSCESGQNMCGNLCVNLLIDAKHCGTCDTDCNHQFNDTKVRFIECLTGTCAITACNNNYSPSEDKTMCVRTSKEWNYNGLSKYDEPSSVFGVKYKIDKDRHCLTTSEWSTGYSFVAFYADNSNFSSEGYVSVKYRVGNASQFKQIVLYLLSNYSDNNQDLANAPRFSLDPTATEWTVFTQKLPQNQNNTLAVAIMAEVESRTTVLDIEYVKVYGR